MPIISNKKPSKTTIKIAVDEDVLQNVKKYCEVFNKDIDSMDDFFNEAAKLVFLKDADWKDYQKNLKNGEPKS